MQKTFTITTKTSKGKYREITAKTIVPDSKPNPGTGHKYRTIKAEFQARYLSGRNTGSNKRVGSDKKFATAMNHFSKFMDKCEHIHSTDSLNKGHVDRFLDYLKTGPSLLSSAKKLADGTVKDVLSNMRKVFITIGKDHFLKGTYADMGLKTAHNDKENPIKFTPDYVERRDAYQQMLEHCRTTWYAVAAQLGRAFGLREAERIESRDVITRKDGKLHATHNLGKSKPISEKELIQRYGKTIMERAGMIKEGKLYLIVENAKGDRNRFVEIKDGARREAVDRLHAYIRNEPGHKIYMTVYPDKTTNQQAERNYTRIQERYGATVESQLHSHGDRHHEAQTVYAELLASGMSIKEARLEVTEMLGHSDPRKCMYYFK